MTHSTLSVTIRPYSDASFVLYGEDSKELKDEIMEHGGRWNPNLKNPLYPKERLKAYIFSNKRKPELLAFLKEKQVSVINIDVDGKLARRERVIDPNRPKSGRYEGKRLMIRMYGDHFVIVYGDLTEEIEDDILDLEFIKSNTLRNPNSNKVMSGLKAKKSAKQRLIDFCLMQDIDYTVLTNDQEDIF